jgi:soluble lytic murein transglycosylase-like protein
VPKAEAIRTTRQVASVVSARYDALISEHSRAHDVRSDLVRAVVQVESGFNPNARSPKGAMGLMQLMPATARQFGVRNAFNPVENVRAGVAYLRQLLDRYDNDERLALAAYNAGPGAVDKYGQKVPPYRETKDYVARISQITDARRPVQMRGSVIYKSTEVVDGHEIIRYSDHKPTAGSYEVVGR